MPSRKPTPVIVSGYSSQALAQEIAEAMSTNLIEVTHKQFTDNEIQTTIENNVRGREVIVIASAAGDPNKQEKETRLLMRAANRAGASKVTLLIPYMWYGRSDDIWDERHSPTLIDTIETLRPHCSSVVVVDPHNAGLTRETFLGSEQVKVCEITHFAFPYAVQLRALMDEGKISRDNLLFTHADAGSTKRITRSFRTCMYDLLGFPNRNPNQDDWAQGLKDRDKVTGKSKIKGISADVIGKDIVIFEDMIASGGTACELAALLKEKGARSVILFATSGLFTADIKNGDISTAAIARINNSQLDAVFITDTYDHTLTYPTMAVTIAQSPIIHTIKTAPYLAAILRALHMEVTAKNSTDENSVSALLKGKHPAQRGVIQAIVQRTSLKQGSPLLALGR